MKSVEEVVSYHDKFLLDDVEIENNSEVVKYMKYFYRTFDNGKDLTLDKYISPPRGYLFGEDVR